jgi:hypothetical protein
MGEPMNTSDANEIEVWIAMNEAGEYDVGCDEDDAIDRWNDKCPGISRRLVRLRVTMSAPDVTSAGRERARCRRADCHREGRLMVHVLRGGSFHEAYPDCQRV